MPVTPKEVFENINRDFNSDEHLILLEIFDSIDYFLVTNFKDSEVYFREIKQLLERVHINRKDVFIEHIKLVYATSGWKVKYDSTYHQLSFNAKH